MLVFVIFVASRTTLRRFLQPCSQFIYYAFEVFSLILFSFFHSIYLLAIAFLSHYDLYFDIWPGVDWHSDSLNWHIYSVVHRNKKLKPKSIQFLGSCIKCEYASHTHQDVHEIRWIGTHSGQLMLQMRKAIHWSHANNNYSVLTLPEHKCTRVCVGFKYCFN